MKMLTLLALFYSVNSFAQNSNTTKVVLDKKINSFLILMPLLVMDMFLEKPLYSFINQTPQAINIVLIEPGLVWFL